MRNRTALGALIGATLVLAAACSDDDDAVADAAQGLCSSLDALQSTVNQVAGSGVDPDSTTVGDVQGALDEIQSGVQDVQGAEADVSDSVKSSLQDAFDTYQSALDGISSDDTLAQAGDAVASAQSQFQQAWTDTLSQLKCPSPSPTS